MKIANYNKLIQFAVNRLNYTVEGKQKEILESTKQVKVIRAARRTGKSFNVALITYALLCYSQATGTPLNIIFAGPRSEDTRRMWDFLHAFLGDEIAAAKVRTKVGVPIQGLEIKFNNYHSESTGKKRLTFVNGTQILNATCDNPEMDDIRGGAYDFLAVDEYGNIDYKDRFMEAASQALKDKNRLNLMMIIGTPDLGMGEEFDALFDLGQTKHDKIKSWKLTESDCPNISKEDANLMNSLLTNDGRLREVLAEPVPVGGLLFPEFNYNQQVVPQSYNPLLPYIIGVDFGRKKPVVEFFQDDDGDFRVFYEIGLENILIDPLVDEIKLIVSSICNGNQPLILGCDRAGNNRNDSVPWPSFQVLKKAFPQAAFVGGGNLVLKVNQSILYRSLTIQKRIWVDPSCKKLATAFIKATQAGTKNKIQPGWAKVDGIDDPLDALMYGLINYNPGLIVSQEKSKLLTESQRTEKENSFFGL